MVDIRRVDGLTPEIEQGLTDLIIAVNETGNSMGFLRGLPREEFAAYWRQVGEKLGPEHGLWTARMEGEILGSIQLARAAMPNSRMRGEIMKMMVLPEWRRRGIAAALLEEAVSEARRIGLRTLVLDTEEGTAEPFYESQGWIRVGRIPDFAASSDGRLIATIYYYLPLGAGG